MRKEAWQLSTSIDGVIFDCDSTLSAVEGITELAKFHQVYQQVHELTEDAMARTGMNALLYQQRLQLVNPAYSDMEKVAKIYWQERTQDIEAVINTLQAAGKVIYVVSAGLQQCVEPFAAKLNIPAAHVFAVSIQFDADGTYVNFDESSPLITSTGKSQIVAQLKAKHRRLALIGDGMNDIEASKVVDRFIGYGGSCYRQNIADLSPFYLRCTSMLPVLSLLLTDLEVEHLSVEGQALYHRGLKLITEQQVEFRTVS